MGLETCWMAAGCDFELKPWNQVFSPWKSHWRSKWITCFKKASIDHSLKNEQQTHLTNRPVPKKDMYLPTMRIFRGYVCFPGRVLYITLKKKASTDTIWRMHKAFQSRRTSGLPVRCAVSRPPKLCHEKFQNSMPFWSRKAKRISCWSLKLIIGRNLGVEKVIRICHMSWEAGNTNPGAKLVAGNKVPSIWISTDPSVMLDIKAMFVWDNNKNKKRERLVITFLGSSLSK